MRVTGTISQLFVTGTITQNTVGGDISQLSVVGNITEGGVTHEPPVFVSAIMTGINELPIIFDRNIYLYSVPEITDFVLAFSGGAVTVSGVTIPNDGGIHKTIFLTLSRAIGVEETGTVSYIPGTNPIRSDADNEGVVSAFTETVTVHDIVGTAPAFVSAVVENAAPTKVVFTYDQALDETSTPDVGDYAPSGGRTSTLVEVSGVTVTVTVNSAYEYGDVITINYTAGANPIRGAIGLLDADSLVAAPVTNNVADTSLIPYIDGFDWPDDNADGYGNGWIKIQGNGVGSIVTGNGFSGRAQRFTHILGTISRLEYSTGINLEIGATYRIKGKFRAGANNWRIYPSLNLAYWILNMGTNIGDAIAFEYNTIATGVFPLIITFYKHSAQANDYLEIDEIRVHKIT